MNDAEARDAIRTDLGTTMMVEAAAGTGKTTSLVTRAVALLREKKCDVSELAAITFTVKAAAQLRERLQAELERNPVGVENALRNLDRAFIGTTHAFCARLLRERPIEAGLDPDFQEVDQVEAALDMRDFWQRWYGARVAVGAPELVRAREAGLTPDLLRDAFIRLVDFHGDVEIASEECARPELKAGVDQVRAFLALVKDDLPDGTAEKQDPFEVMVRALLRFAMTRDLDDPKQQLAFLAEAAHASKRPVQRNWPDKGRAKRYGEDYIAIGRHAKLLLAQWREFVHCIAMNVVRPALADYALERRQTARVTFNDLLLGARNLLRDHPQVRSYFQRRFKHVLVDEFQDTDPLQAEMLFYLTGSDVQEKRWTRLTPKPGSLFIVGDPKQSIYRFRRADITTYLSVKERIEQTGGRIVALSTNFRSSRAICDFVNGGFPAIFDSASVEAKMQAPHVDLGHHHEGGPLDGVYLLEQQTGKNDEICTAEAGCVAAWIRRAVDSGHCIDDHGKERPLRWFDFLLVSRNRTRLHLYAEALERMGVPFEVTGAQRFSESRWLHAVLPLLRAVVDPEDPVPVVSFLRGPCCGAGDDELLQFVNAEGKWSPFRQLPAGTSPAIAEGFAMLRDAIRDARDLSPAAAIARTFERVGVVAAAAAEEQAGTAAGNVLLALTIAREESARGASYAVVVERLAALLEEAADIEEMDVDPSRENAVRLMNLHQVKGLEAPVVFLIDPTEGRPWPPDQHIDRSDETSRGWFAIRKKKGFGSEDIALPREWDAYAQRETLFGQAEDRRLLYVAATRARNVLVVGISRKNGTVEGRWKELARGVTQTLFATGQVERATVPPSPAGESFDEGMARIEAQRAEAGRMSYSVAPITKIAHDHALIVKAEEGLGKGTSWGRVLHRLFEAMLREPELDIRFYAESLLKDEERDATEVAEVVHAVDALRSSPLWQRVLAADEKYAEVPFALEVPARTVGIDFEGNTLLHGAIDLVFREGDVWFIIDYKSDSTVNRLAALVEYYRPQVAHYVRFWHEMTGAETKGGLFFVDGAKEVML